MKVKNNKKKTIKTILLILAGLALGVSWCILLGLYYAYQDPYTIIKGRPKRFGNVELQSVDLQRGAQVLLITKDKTPFIVIERNTNGMIKSAGMLSEDCNDIRASLDTSDTGKWQNFCYFKSINKMEIGYKWLDFDFDGQFDYRSFKDNDGNLISQHIMFNSKWIEVENVSRGFAKTKNAIYSFSHMRHLWEIKDHSEENVEKFYLILLSKGVQLISYAFFCLQRVGSF